MCSSDLVHAKACKQPLRAKRRQCCRHGFHGSAGQSSFFLCDTRLQRGAQSRKTVTQSNANAKRARLQDLQLHGSSLLMESLSIVIPVYRGARTIGPLVERLERDVGTQRRLEIVLVNDGSPDDSAAVCQIGRAHV